MHVDRWRIVLTKYIVPTIFLLKQNDLQVNNSYTFYLVLFLWDQETLYGRFFHLSLHKERVYIMLNDWKKRKVEIKNYVYYV